MPMQGIAAICTAHSRQTGLPCKNRAMVGRSVCRLHGGKTPRGVASPNFKHGNYSKYHVPERLRDSYERALQDPDLLSLRSDIAVIDSRLSELVETVDVAATSSLLLQIREAFSAWSKSDNDDDLVRLSSLIKRGADTAQAWGEVQQGIELRRKLVQSESKRLDLLQQNISKEQALVIMAMILDTIHRHVKDKTALRAISEDLQGIIGTGAPKSLPTASVPDDSQ